MRGMRRGALAVEFEHARTFAGWDATLTIFACTRLTCFGRGPGLASWDILRTSVLERIGRSEGMKSFS